MSSMKRFTGLAVMALAMAAILGAAQRAAASEEIRGLITERGDTSFVLQLDDGQPVTVLFTDNTRISMNGTSKTLAFLMPGLRVGARGDYNTEHQLVAAHVEFDYHDLQIAYANAAAFDLTRKQAARNAADIDRQAGTLIQHYETLGAHSAKLGEQGDAIVANRNETLFKASDLNRRVDNVDDWRIVDKLIVYFKDGRYDLAPEYAAQLREFAEKSRSVHGYMIEVKGYASAVGPREYNQVLSEKRTDVVVRALTQTCGVPPASMFVPAAMGISEQFAENNTAKGQAENRRVVVSIYQNVGVSANVTAAGN